VRIDRGAREIDVEIPIHQYKPCPVQGQCLHASSRS
jgi:hypothetical protein